MRNAFIDELVLLAKSNPSIVLVVGDLGYSVVEPFADQFPKRFFNAGVAEQNMTGLAAGLASEGHHVFTYSIANFPSFRCAEQIRNDIDYHNLPVTIVAVGGGLAYGALGYSHHAVQDYSLFRSFPNTLIASPGDPFEVRACLRYLVDNPCPSYLRLGKAGEPTFHKSIPTIKPGKWIKYKEGNKKSSAILSTGATMSYAFDWVKDSKFQDFEIYSMPLWSMSSKRHQINMIKDKKEILTLEDHLQDGGFGSWMLEANSLIENSNTSIKTVALDSKVCGTVGSQEMLNKLGGIVK